MAGVTRGSAVERDGCTTLRLSVSPSCALENGQERQVLGVLHHTHDRRKKTGLRRLALSSHRI